MATSEKDFDFYYDYLKTQSLASLCSTAPEAWKMMQTPVEKAQIRGLYLSRASELGLPAIKTITSLFDRLAAQDMEDQRKRERQIALLNADSYPAYLELDRNGNPMATTENYYTIMSYDHHYDRVHYNELKNMAECHNVMADGSVNIEPWTTADEADSAKYIEKEFHFFNEKKHRMALALFFKDRAYNPVKDIVEMLEWDGTERIKDFLCKWMKVIDSPYSREISRLIFAGGINRLYDPGCKFDEVPVLIGTQQGEGKSSIVSWLAIDEEYFAEVTQFEGMQAIEQLSGAWICELSELLALNRAKDQEGVKSFITRKTDKYRKPYEPVVSVLPRRCIFIATTNNQTFLKDKTGNRRFYPIEVHSVGYELYEHEQEIRDYICQCWAEAREKYKAGKMPPYADRELLDDYKKAQEDAMEDDWREGALASYLAKMRKGERVCARQIMREALCFSCDFPRDPTKKESMEITQMMAKQPAWERKEKMRCGTYGFQRCWEKKWDDTPQLDTSDRTNPLIG